MGGVDVILDDGSHVMDHIKASLQILYPLLQTGGTYMIEDLHTAYWKHFGGGLGRPANFFTTLRQLVDDMHAWYHSGERHHPEIADWCSGIHIHDSICVLDKEKVYAPTHSTVLKRR